MIRHSSSCLGSDEAQAALTTIEGNFVGTGPAAAALEAHFRQITGRRHAFAVSSGFHATALALRALDLPPGSSVALPILTCASSLAAIRGAGHSPWLADICPDDFTLDPATCGGAAAIVAPHAYGAPLDVERIGALGVPWIEDCATSPATTVEGRPVGTFGTLAVFSLGSTKYITGGAGGLLLMDDDLLAARVSDLLDFETPTRPGHWRHDAPPPLPGRLPDLNAAVALAQARRLPGMAAQRRLLASHYLGCLVDVNTVEVLPHAPGHSYYRFIVKTSGAADGLARALQASGIDARDGVNPWLDAWGPADGGPWPVAAGWREHLLSLPIHPGMSIEDVHAAVHALREAAKRHSHAA